MSERDLELVSTDDLVKELFVRFDTAVFTGKKDYAEMRAGHEVYWKGEMFSRFGLTVFAKEAMMDEFRN